MTIDPDRIVVEVPASDSRREQIERRVFEQLAALRIADRVDAAVARPRRRMWPVWVTVGGFAAACIVLVLLLGRREPAVPVASSPSLVQTPAGGSTRFTVGDAVIDAGSDTSVMVQQDPIGGVTLVLARGSVDCEVEPRHGRPPFRVVAGDVTVAVVGTRFTVSRSATGVRVDVARGKVRVTSPSGEQFVAAGDSWRSGDTITAVATVPPAIAPTAEPVPAEPAPAAQDPIPEKAPVAPSSHAAFVAAQRLEAHDRAAAARAYRAVAGGNDSWAALALYSLAQLEAQSHPVAALEALDAYRRRFAHGANAEDAAWLRVEVLRSAGRQGEVAAAASAYLKAYPAGSYVEAVKRLADIRP